MPGLLTERPKHKTALLAHFNLSVSTTNLLVCAVVCMGKSMWMVRGIIIGRGVGRIVCMAMGMGTGTGQ